MVQEKSRNCSCTGIFYELSLCGVKIMVDGDAKKSSFCSEIIDKNRFDHLTQKNVSCENEPFVLVIYEEQAK